MKFFLCLAFLAAAGSAHAIPIGSGGGPTVPSPHLNQSSPKNLHPRVAREKEQEEQDRRIKIWAGLPIGAALGFGLGHLMQERLSGYAIAYPVADGIGWGLVFSAMGSCRSDPRCENQKNNRRKAGLILLGASRVVQVVDLALFGIRHERGAQLLIRPTQEGAALSAQFRF